jgi:hypothetical protein
MHTKYCWASAVVGSRLYFMASFSWCMLSSVARIEETAITIYESLAGKE